MSKEKIDEILKELEKFNNSYDYQQRLDAIKNICMICGAENLWGEIQKKLDENMLGKEDVEDDYKNLIQQVIDKIHSQIPDNLKVYFYFKTIDRKVEELVFNDEQRDNYEIRINNLSDEEKIEIIKELNDEDEKFQIILLIIDDNKKISLLNQLKHEILKAEVIKTLGDDAKYEVLDELENEIYREEVINTIKKQEVLERLEEDRNKVNGIISIENLDDKIKELKKLEKDRHKVDVINTIIDEEKRLEIALEVLNRDSYKVTVIKKIKDDGIKINGLNFFKGQEWLEIAETLKDESKIELLEKCDENVKLQLIRTIKNPELVLKGLDKLEYKDLLKRLYQKNKDVINIDVRLLDKAYLETLGEDKINQISCYPKIQNTILTLSEKEYNIFARCLDASLSDFETDEWTTIAYSLLVNLQNGEYETLIENLEDIEKIDIQKFSKILQLKNYFNIETAEDIENFEEIKRKKCDAIINGISNVQEKKNAILLKLIGIDRKFAETILMKYGDDINSIEDGYEKDFVIAIQEIMNLTDEDILKQIYNECEDIGIVDINLLERFIKNAYGKKYNEGLYETKFEDIIEEKDLPEELRGLKLNVYEAGTEFKMIVTSVAGVMGAFCKIIAVAGFIGTEWTVENYKENWNRQSLASQFFCASYIRNDMIGTALIPNLCYGFIQMKEDSLMLSGPTDIGSLSDEIVPWTVSQNFYSPDKQINETERYNEMCYRRIQGGRKKQPDYIVAFKRMGIISNIDNIVQASQDWEGKLPIVIVDIDRCLESERGKILGDEQNERRISFF